MAVDVKRRQLDDRDQMVEITERCDAAVTFDYQDQALLLLRITAAITAQKQKEEVSVVKIYAPGEWISAEQAAE